MLLNLRKEAQGIFRSEASRRGSARGGDVCQQSDDNCSLSGEVMSKVEIYLQLMVSGYTQADH